MQEVHRTFIPAAGHDWALPLYDPLVKLIGGDRARCTLVKGAGIQPGHRVLDLGCGTGSLAVSVARRHSGVEVVGLDPDPRALLRARRKAQRAGVSIHFDQGFADALPYPDAAFDHVLSSFVFHHLQADEKARMLEEARRVLKPGGALSLLDFAGAGSGAGPRARWLHSRPLLQDNAEDRIVARMGQAGFAGVRTIGGGSVIFGLAAYACFQGTAPR
jgi:SAM-dependent methyltransferase